MHLYSTVQYGKNTDFLDPIPEYIGRSRGTYEECPFDEFIGYRITPNIIVLMVVQTLIWDNVHIPIQIILAYTSCEC